MGVNESQVQQAVRDALAPLERQDAQRNTGGSPVNAGANAGGENPYQIQYDLQEMMQTHAGIVRSESDLNIALEQLGKLKARAAEAAAPGNREYNPGWHTALDLQNLLTVSEALILSGLDRKESRGGHFREDYPSKDEGGFGKHNTIIRRASDGTMQVERRPIPPMPPELKQVVEENK